MSTTIVVEGKVLGQKQPLITDWNIKLPPLYQRDGDRIKLRDLITCVVVKEVEAFQKRQDQRKLARILAPAEIEQGVRTGKIDSGERNLKQEVNKDEAVGTALQAFEDGLYFVFVDGLQQTDLDSEVYLKNRSAVTFVRLVALAGG